MSDTITAEITPINTFVTPTRPVARLVRLSMTGDTVAPVPIFQVVNPEQINSNEDVPEPVPILRDFTYQARNEINPSDVTTLQEDFASRINAAEALEEEDDITEVEPTTSDDIIEVEPAATEVPVDDDVIQAFIRPVTRAYVDSMVEPYLTALSAADSTESIRTWLPMILQDPYLEEITTMTSDITDVEEMKALFVQYLTGKLFELAHAQTYQDMLPILPWDVARIKDPLFTKLFGEPSTTIPVQVTVGPNIYVHMLSQDFTFGLLSALCKDTSYSFKISGVELDITHLQSRYEPNAEVQHLYAATFPTGKAEFDTPETIQGINTAAQWLNIDSRTLVKDLTQLADNVALEF
jgi:hypothetical protein